MIRYLSSTSQNNYYSKGYWEHLYLPLLFSLEREMIFWSESDFNYVPSLRFTSKNVAKLYSSQTKTFFCKLNIYFTGSNQTKQTL